MVKKMDRVQQKQIVDEMLEGLKESLYKRLDIVPESWDGIELRWWLYDTVEVQFVSYINSNYKRKGRRRDYLNDLKMNPNLL